MAMRLTVGWGWLILAAIALGIGAWMTRYQHLQPIGNGMGTLTLDRWTHKICVTIVQPESYIPTSYCYDLVPAHP